jgi:hypothetical protein
MNTDPSAQTPTTTLIFYGVVIAIVYLTVRSNRVLKIKSSSSSGLSCLSHTHTHIVLLGLDTDNLTLTGAIDEKVQADSRSIFHRMVI